MPHYRPGGIDDGELTRGSGIEYVEHFGGNPEDPESMQSLWLHAATDVLYAREIPHYCRSKRGFITIEFASQEGLEEYKRLRERVIAEKVAKHIPGAYVP